MLTSNVEPRRIVKHASRAQRCAACGVRGFVRSHDMPFCTGCSDWARQKNLLEWDDIGGSE